jgi:protein O-GlcNAc transferase
MSKVGRNDPCACGSGKKFKQCCMLKQPSLLGSKVNSAPAQKSSNNGKLNLALKHLGFGRKNEAVILCQDILRRDPNHHEALNLLGILAYQAGNDQLAIQLLKRSTAAAPQYADAHNNLGAVYREMGRFQDAALSFEEALRVKPSYVDALINYGNVLQDLGNYPQSLVIYKQVLNINPRHLGALSNFGNVLQELNRHADAVEVFTRLLEIDPNYELALGSLIYSKLHCCDWQTFEQDKNELLSSISKGRLACKPFDLLAIADSPAQQLDCAQTFARNKYPQMHAPAPYLQVHKAEKIRVAYISADFRQHAVSQLLVELIEQHDRSQFEIIGVMLRPQDNSDLGKRICDAFDQFFVWNEKSDSEIAAQLRALNVSIAIDLMGYTTHGRPGIFASRAAPIQIGYLGYAGTTGSEYIDYVIADSIVIPSQIDKHFSEKIVRMPDCFQPNDTYRKISAATPPRSTLGLPENGFVFCAFNNHYKITPDIFDVWMRLLAAVPDSVLWLANCKEIARNNLSREASLRGVNPERLIFAERTALLEDHLARYRAADLFLDTLPYNAHTTASDALWAGLPVITCQGNSFASRVASSLLINLGLPELVTQSLPAYEQLAFVLAGDPARLSEIKNTLIKNIGKMPLFNIQKYRKNLEEAYLEMLKKPSIIATDNH